MVYSELAYRYAAALFDLAVEAKKVTEYLQALRGVQAALDSNTTVKDFVASPLVRAEDKAKTLVAALKDSGVPEAVINFTTLLAHKGRLILLAEIIAAYQAREDELNGITRGVVKTSAELTEKQKLSIASTLSSITKKKVILQYTEEKALLGGLTAQVGSLTFDDSLAAHLRRIKEDLTRRIN